MAGAIEGETLLQAKGRAYTLGELLAGDAALAARYRGGRFATIYLAPYNYHRIHMPLAGALRGSLVRAGAPVQRQRRDRGQRAAACSRATSA